MCLYRNMNRYPPERRVVLEPEYLGRTRHPGIHMHGSIVIDQKEARMRITDTLLMGEGDSLDG